MVLGIYKISGHSMIPFFNPNDRVLVSSLPYNLIPPKVNDVIIFKYKKIIVIKRIRKINYDRILPSGDNKKDSLKTSWINKKDIIGKVLFKI